MVSSKLQDRLAAFEQKIQDHASTTTNLPAPSSTFSAATTTTTSLVTPNSRTSPAAAVGFRRGMSSAVKAGTKSINFPTLSTTSSTMSKSSSSIPTSKAAAVASADNNNQESSTSTSLQSDLAAADQGNVSEHQHEQSMDFSKPPLKKTGSGSSASPTEDESHSHNDSFLVDELAVVGSGATVTYTADSSFASFDEQLRAAREREARRRLAAEQAGAVLSPGSVSVRERQKLLLGKSMPHLKGLQLGGDEGEESPKFVSPAATSRSKFLSRAANSRNILTSPVIDEDEPLPDEPDEVATSLNEHAQPESSSDQPDDSDEAAAAVYNPPALLNQELSMGESYTSDYSLTSFDEQVKIARKREMERRRSETSLKLGAAAPTMSLKERMKMFGK